MLELKDSQLAFVLLWVKKFRRNGQKNGFASLASIFFQKKRVKI